MWIAWVILHELVKNMVSFEGRPHYLVAISIIQKKLPLGKLTK
jgi:hypothetical protein